ncbi:AbfB domain-containing protein [Amycolatopsis sp. PS_44_ISF1]|uniref:AbfB domain-containing protein n=1 Tax=Amycolatopsis sp. PS_44_ISF1 TaxID=2974917 RepID=UPI0028DF7852|nr:AbfB domain-containing protein [Amycolatopsis sp. PS_44_ISF1]MDT8914737.1 AbfB domain-containing protein [Amycolatopsis sp. PS_44_ISF1]
MDKKRAGRLARAVVAATTAGLLIGLGAPFASAATLPAAPPTAPSVPSVPSAEVLAEAPAGPAAAALPEATPEEKVNAVRSLGLDIDNGWLVLRDRDFVFKIFDTADPARFPMVKAGALQAYRDGDTASTLFIRSGVTDVAGRDRDNYARGQLERDQARRLKQSAAALMAMPVTEQQLDLGYRDFIYELWHFVTGYPKVKAAALAAFDAPEADQKTFLASGLLAAKRQDQVDAANADKDRTEAEKARLIARAARENAATVVGLTTTDVMLDLADDFFIRKLLEKAVSGTQVAIAGQAALNSANPADWKAYIASGIYTARDRDVAIENEKKAAENRRVAREIKARAENGGMRPRLVAAAAAALAGSDSDVETFLLTGQDAAPAQSLEATTRGSRGGYVTSNGGNTYVVGGDPGTQGSAKLTGATWKIRDGLADANCFSLESTQLAGSYLRTDGDVVKLAASDGGTPFKNDATWCSSPGQSGSGVSLESYSHRGHFLRHWGGQVYAATSADDAGYNASRLFKEDITWSVVDPDPEVTTPIVSRWKNDDAIRVILGAPVAPEVYDAFNGGVRYRDYAGGRMYWSAATGAHAVTGAALEKYESVGEYHWQLPIIDTTPTPNVAGSFTHVANGGSIYFSPATGAHLIYGAIRERWAQLDWERSYLGFPTADEASVGTLRRSTFEHGIIDHDPATGKTRDYRA